MPALPTSLVGSDAATDRQSLRHALVVFAATFVLLPITLAAAGALTARSKPLADGLSTAVLVGPLIVSAVLLALHASRRGGYPAALALGLAAPAAAVCFVVLMNALGLAESDLALAPTVGTVLAITTLCSTALYLASVALRFVLTRPS